MVNSPCVAHHVPAIASVRTLTCRQVIHRTLRCSVCQVLAEFDGHDITSQFDGSAGGVLHAHSVGARHLLRQYRVPNASVRGEVEADLFTDKCGGACRVDGADEAALRRRLTEVASSSACSSACGSAPSSASRPAPPSEFELDPTQPLLRQVREWPSRRRTTACTLYAVNAPYLVAADADSCRCDPATQVGRMSPTAYARWVSSPVPGSPRFFASDVAESLTKVQWWVVPCLWIPCAAWFLASAAGASGVQLWQASQLWQAPEGPGGAVPVRPVQNTSAGPACALLPTTMEGVASLTTQAAHRVLATTTLPHVVPHLSVPSLLAAALAGVLLWQLLEYSLHRWVFHARVRGPRTQFLHFLLHGCHHKYPQDTVRLVFPPLPASWIATGIYAALRALLPSAALARAVFGGVLLAYVAYDCSHYFIHAGVLRGALARSHLRHHFADSNARFGISSPLLDALFGTMTSSAPGAGRQQAKCDGAVHGAADTWTIATGLEGTRVDAAPPTTALTRRFAALA